ncbi:MAG TPA: hypothetical protein VGI86_17250 [Acidimicrobiia bacterium]|jgi:multisubunit Na+/H+ antiporter MnhB subunit
MAAPRSRRLRNQAAPVTHSRREWMISILGSAGIVLVTLILIWAMRPGGADATGGSGGVFHRQPRVALWLLATSAVIGIVSWLILRHDSKVRNPLRALLLGISGVVVVAVAVLGVWHNSLVHDYAVPTVPTVPATTVPPATTTPTTASGASTTAPATTAPTQTTVAAPSTTGG